MSLREIDTNKNTNTIQDRSLLFRQDDCDCFVNCYLGGDIHQKISILNLSKLVKSRKLQFGINTKLSKLYHIALKCIFSKVKKLGYSKDTF